MKAKNVVKQTQSNPVGVGGGRLADIQMLRFLSALAVSLFHVGFLDSLGKDYGIWLVNGVYIFYAISGYVTMLSTEKGCRKFMLKRLIKIFPIYWFLTFATFAVMKLIPQFFPYNPTFTELLKSLFLIPYEHQSTSSTHAIYPIVSMGHTIQTTMLYYLVFWFAANYSHKLRGWLSCLVIIAIVVFGMLYKPSSIFLKFYLKPDLIYFVAGIGAYYICKTKIFQKFNLTSFTLMLTVVLFIVTMCLHNRWLLLVIIFLMILSTIQSGKSKLMESGIFKKMAIMGNWTFSYFLIHLYIVRFAEVFGGTNFSLKAVVFDLIAIIVAWGISYVLYELIEKRFTNVLKKQLL